MGEKKPYKARNPGGGRKKRKPEYDAGKTLKEQLDAAVVLYNSEMSLQAIADALSLNPIKVRKLLITAGVYESDTAKLVRQTFNLQRNTKLLHCRNHHHGCIAAVPSLCDLLSAV